MCSPLPRLRRAYVAGCAATKTAHHQSHLTTPRSSHTASRSLWWRAAPTTSASMCSTPVARPGAVRRMDLRMARGATSWAFGTMTMPFTRATPASGFPVGLRCRATARTDSNLPWRPLASRARTLRTGEWCTRTCTGLAPLFRCACWWCHLPPPARGNHARHAGQERAASRHRGRSTRGSSSRSDLDCGRLPAKNQVLKILTGTEFPKSQNFA